MDLTALQDTLRSFAAEREWQSFHTPKNLAMALMVEAAELAEIFQWMTPEQSVAAHTDQVLRERIGEEVADVLLYLVQLADHTRLDLQHAVARKLVKNAKKHPPLKPGLPVGPVTLTESQTHVLIDWENVQPKETDIRVLVPDVTNVWIFHGPNQKKVGAHQTSFGDRITLIPISRTGKNALDFHLSFYMGYITSRNPKARFVVISNDQGYGPMLEHAADLGFAASQVGFGGRKAPAKRAATKKVAVKKTTPKKSEPQTQQPSAQVPGKKAVASKSRPPKTRVHSATAPQPAPEVSKVARTTVGAGKPRVTKSSPKTAKKAKVPARKPAQAAAEPVDPAYAHVVAGLRKAKDKPSRKARLYGLVKSFLNVTDAKDPAVEAVVQRLVVGGQVEIDDKGAVRVKL